MPAPLIFFVLQKKLKKQISNKMIEVYDCINTKRRRSNPVGATLEDPRGMELKNQSRDCYDEVMKGGSHLLDHETKNDEDTTGAPTVRSSWLYSIMNISASDRENNNNDSTSRGLDMADQDMVEASFASSSSLSTSSSTMLRDEIQSLQRQLSQVKRRLGPAAERCTEAWNAAAGDRLYGYTTTGQREFQQARRACNPFESLGEVRDGGLNVHFINRSAIKLANVDALLNFTLTNVVNSSSASTTNAARCFRFADLCGAPGGFSEYLLRRCQERAISCCGYGMSLIGNNEYGQGVPWKLPEIDLDSSIVQDETTSSTTQPVHDPGSSAVQYLTDESGDVGERTGVYSQFRICTGADGTGDLYWWENVQSFVDLISSYHTTGVSQPSDLDHQHGVDLVVSDGGFDAQRDAEHQEELTQKLVVCQVAAALAVLKPGGTFVIKMFGFQTSVIRTVLADLFLRRFESMQVLKPISSRPASAERYVVCHGFQGNEADWTGPGWMNRMFLANSGLLPSSPTTTNTIVGLLPTNQKQRLHQYLDEFDRDMLRLNLKTCFAILSYLETKCLHTTALEPDEEEENEDENGLVIGNDFYHYDENMVDHEHESEHHHPSYGDFSSPHRRQYRLHHHLASSWGRSQSHHVNMEAYEVAWRLV